MRLVLVLIAASDGIWWVGTAMIDEAAGGCLAFPMLAQASIYIASLQPWKWPHWRQALALFTPLDIVDEAVGSTLDDT